MIQRLGLKNLRDDQPLTINGLDAHTGISTIDTGAGMRSARFTVIYFNQRAYIMVGVSKDPGTMSHFDVAFLETARSFHQLTGDERLLARPLRLKIIESTEETNFTSLTSQSPLEQYQEEKLRLLNGLYPTGKANSKLLLKIVN